MTLKFHARHANIDALATLNFEYSQAKMKAGENSKFSIWINDLPAFT